MPTWKFTELEPPSWEWHTLLVAIAQSLLRFPTSAVGIQIYNVSYFDKHVLEAYREMQTTIDKAALPRPRRSSPAASSYIFLWLPLTGIRLLRVSLYSHYVSPPGGRGDFVQDQVASWLVSNLTVSLVGESITFIHCSRNGHGKELSYYSLQRFAVDLNANEHRGVRT